MSNIDVARDNASSNVPDTLITINLNEPSSTTTTNDGQSEQQPAAAATVAPPEELNPSSGSQRSLNSRMFPFRLSRDIILQNVFQEIRPLVQHTNWMRSVHSAPTTTDETSQTDHNTRSNADIPGNANSDSVVINFGSSPSTSTYARQHSAPARSSIENENDGMGTASANESRTSLQHQNASADSNGSNVTNSGAENDPNSAENGGNNPDSLSQIPEARALINTISRYFPYVCILFAKTAYDHLDGILDIFALFVVFAHSNFTLKQEITKQGQRRFLYLIRELIYIVLVVTIIGFILEKKDTFISLFFAPINLPTDDKPMALKDMLFSVCITDLILKLFTVAIKILFTMLPRNAIEFKNRGRVYLLMEAISQLYRALVPIQLWLMYLLESYKGTEKIMGVILGAAYIVAKGSDILQRVKFLKRAFVKFLQKTSFGTTPTKEQIQASGGICPICHDNFSDAVILNECSHIFCETCLLGWLDRENNTCPMCRAQVVDDPSSNFYRDGSTTFFIQFY